MNIGAGLAIDGRTVTQEILEKKIEEVMVLHPPQFRQFHQTINGRQNAMDLIIATVNTGNADIRPASRASAGADLCPVVKK